MISDKLSLNRESVQTILLRDLGMQKVCTKMVPKILYEDQKRNRVKFCEDMLEKIKDNPDVFKQIITGDKTQVFQYNPETKRQIIQWKTAESSRPKKACDTK